MHFTKLQTPKKAGFRTAAVYRKAEHASVTSIYMKQKTSFFVAAISLVAFISGNMMGQHGWYAFWKSVMGAADDSLIQYNGMVVPIEFVPDYSRWSAYGGGSESNTYRQVPKDILIPLPAYNASTLSPTYYSVGHMGSYATGHEGDGSHPGVDIRVPEGTPVRSIANGIVTRVTNDAEGYGQYIVIRNPHVPDPERPGKTMVIHSIYAHLSAQYVEEGDIVSKGQQIGLSGMTGFASGPHLHFQIDKDSAPWHPYWPFSGSEARSAGLTFMQAINKGLKQENGFLHTINPLVLVQSNGAPSNVAGKPSTVTASVTPTKTSSRPTRDERIAQRKARAVVAVAPAPVIVRQTITAVLEPEEQHQAAPTPVVITPQTSHGSFAGIEIRHDGAFTGREWETVRIVLKDANGNTVQPETFDRDLVLRTAYGEAEFRPATLSSLDFKDGEATVQMLPRGRRTVIIQVQPLGSMSGPMKYTE